MLSPFDCSEIGIHTGGVLAGNKAGQAKLAVGSREEDTVRTSEDGEEGGDQFGLFV